MQIHAPDLIVKHNYELTNVLPILRRTISVLNPSLTDIAPLHEQTRYYQADRALRIVHGLIDFLTTWFQRSSSAPWVIACDDYDASSTLVQSFFVELMRRRGQQINLRLLVATAPGASEMLANQFDAKFLKQGVRLNLPPTLEAPVCKQEMARLARKLEIQVGEDPVQLEIHLPQLIRYSLLSDQPDKALEYQIKASSIYTSEGFYEDGLLYAEAASELFERYCLEDTQKFWNIHINLYKCCTALGRHQQAIKVVEEIKAKIDAPEYLYRWCYMMAMLYARYLPERDLDKAEAYLDKGLEELSRTNLSPHEKLFHTAFNRNGLALVRHRQKRSQESVELCQFYYEQLNAQLKPDEHILHRSVLLYNIGQVYAAVGPYDKAIAYFTKAMAMDPNYSEYYNDRANVYLKMGCLEDAEYGYLKAIESSPPFPEVWSNLGQCYRLMGQMEKAIDAYSTSLDLKPKQFSVLVARAQAFEMLEQPDAALADYNAALDEDANQPLVLANRATLHYEAGLYDQSLADLNQAIALSPQTPDLYQNRAVALTALGRSQEAAKDLKTYLQLNPTAGDRFDVETELLVLQTNG